MEKNNTISVRCPACKQIRNIRKDEVLQGFHYRFVVCNLPTADCLGRPFDCNYCMEVADDAFDPNCKQPVK